MKRLGFQMGLAIFLLSGVSSVSAEKLCDRLMRDLHRTTVDQFYSASGVDLAKPLKTPIELRIYDMDDNLIALDTKIWALDIDKGEEIPLSTEDYARLKTLVGKPGTEYSHLRFYDALVDTQSGQERVVYYDERFKIQSQLGAPGPFQNWRLREITMRGFQDEPDPDVFANDISAALHRDSRWRAPSWNHFEGMMRQPETARWTGILTTRGHDPLRILAGFDRIHTKKYIEHLPRRELIFPIFNPDFPRDIGNSPAERKAETLVGLGEMLERVALEDETQSHRIGFSDDDTRTVDHCVMRLAEQSARLPHIEYTVFNTGLGTAAKYTIQRGQLIRDY